jgi:hypothetical protein
LEKKQNLSLFGPTLAEPSSSLSLPKPNRGPARHPLHRLRPPAGSSCLAQPTPSIRRGDARHRPPTRGGDKTPAAGASPLSPLTPRVQALFFLPLLPFLVRARASRRSHRLASLFCAPPSSAGVPCSSALSCCPRWPKESSGGRRNQPPRLHLPRGRRSSAAPDSPPSGDPAPAGLEDIPRVSRPSSPPASPSFPGRRCVPLVGEPSMPAGVAGQWPGLACPAWMPAWTLGSTGQ